MVRTKATRTYRTLVPHLDARSVSQALVELNVRFWPRVELNRGRPRISARTRRWSALENRAGIGQYHACFTGRVHMTLKSSGRLVAAVGLLSFLGACATVQQVPMKKEF